MEELLHAYLRTFGWAVVGTLSVGVGLILTLKLFTISTPRIDEWEEIKKGNMSMAVVLAAVIIAVGIVVSRVVGS